MTNKEPVSPIGRLVVKMKNSSFDDIDNMVSLAKTFYEIFDNVKYNYVSARFNPFDESFYKFCRRHPFGGALFVMTKFNTFAKVEDCLTALFFSEIGVPNDKIEETIKNMECIK